MLAFEDDLRRAAEERAVGDEGVALIYIYIYIYIHICVVYIYIYTHLYKCIYRERERKYSIQYNNIIEYSIP